MYTGLKLQREKLPHYRTGEVLFVPICTLSKSIMYHLYVLKVVLETFHKVKIDVVSTKTLISSGPTMELNGVQTCANTDHFISE